VGTRVANTGRGRLSFGLLKQTRLNIEIGQTEDYIAEADQMLASLRTSEAPPSPNENPVDIPPPDHDLWDRGPSFWNQTINFLSKLTLGRRNVLPK
jgi:hypothetical protein